MTLLGRLLDRNIPETQIRGTVARRRNARGAGSFSVISAMMWFPLVLALVLTSALATAGPAPARTGPPLQPFPHRETSERSPVSDEARYFVINVRPGLLRVFDTRTRRARDVSVNPACTAVDGTPGRALLACPEGPPSERRDVAFLLRLSNRSISAVPGQSNLSDTRRSWFGIGRYWLRGFAYSATSGKVVGSYLNWRTGEQHYLPDDLDAKELDVDDPGLRRYPPGVIEREGRLSLYGNGAGQLLLGRPGADAPLSGCARSCYGTSLSSSLATWAENDAVRAYDIRARRRLDWALPGTSHTIVHTRSHVLVGIRPSDDDVPKLRWARIRP
jgi:hypothetical protein